MSRIYDPRFNVPIFGTGFYAEYFALPSGIGSLNEINFDAAPDMVGNVSSLNNGGNDVAFWDGGPTDNFAARYTSELNVETSGRHTFSLISDDGSALYIDGVRVINHDGLHAADRREVTVDLTAGVHDIEVRYFEAYGAQTVRLMWETPDAPGVDTIIGAENLSYRNVVADGDTPQDPTDEPDVPDTTTPDTGGDGSQGANTGFYAEYFAVSSNVSSLDDIDFDATPDMVGNVAALNYRVSNNAFWDGGPTDGFAARYTSGLNVEQSGRHTFILNSDDGSALYIDGERVIDHDGLHASQWREVAVDLSAGVHDIEVRYFEAYGAQTLQLMWQPPNTAGRPVLIDGDNLSYGGDAPQAPTDNSDPADDSAGLKVDFFAINKLARNAFDVDFDGTPTKTETVSAINFGDTTSPLWDDGSSHSFAARIAGNLHVEAAGNYTFFLTADDKSALYINGIPVVSHDNPYSMTSGAVTLALTAGTHDIEVRYVEKRGNQNLVLEWLGPDSNGQRTVIDGSSLSNGDVDHGGTDNGGTDGGETDGGGTDNGGSDGGETDGGGTDNGGTDGGETDGDGTDNGGTDGGETDGGGTDNGGTDGGETDGGGTDNGGSDGGETDDGGMDNGGTDGGETDGGGMDHGGTDGGETDDGGMDHGDGTPAEQPQTSAEIEAFVTAAMAEPEGHAHGDDAGKMLEHGQLLDLVPRSEATHIAISDGDWFDASTWYQGNIPDAGAKVLIPKGVTVDYNGESDVSLFTVRVDGEISFATNIDTKMVVDTFVVSGSGRLEMGTADNPIDASVNAEIVIANNGNIDVNWDPSLLSRGVISHGEVEIHGAQKDSFVKVSDAPMRGDTSLNLAEVPEGWQVGDTIVITGTHKVGWANTNERYRGTQDEEVTITAINGGEVTFDRALTYDHDTPRDDLSAYVSNMTRNITFSSEDGDATAVHHRGHVMFMHSDDVDVRYAAFDDLGRTDKSEDAFDVGNLSSVDAASNVKGRYSFHFHRTGTEDQDDPAMAVGNAVSGGPGWGFVHHSSNANFTDNVTFDVFGAGFAAESGDETGIWLGNMAIKSEGIGFGAWHIKDGADVGRQDTGRTGDGFFFAGRLVEAAENVAVNTTNGFVWMHRNPGADPLASSLDHPEIAFGSETIPVNLAPIQGFRNNEAFGTHSGLIVVKDNAAQQNHELRSVFDGFLNWETTEGANISYTAHYTLRDFDILATTNPTPGIGSVGVDIGSMAFDMVFNGLKVEGFDQGVNLNQSFFRSVSDADVDHILIDYEGTNNGSNFVGFNANRHHVLTSDDLTQGRLEFEHNGDTSLSVGEAFDLGGIKTDSIGTRYREYDGDPLEFGFYDEIARTLATDGYYKTEDGRNVVIMADFIADRATGEIMKFSHIITLEPSDEQLVSNWSLNNLFGPVRFNGPISLNGSTPTTVDDAVSTQSGEGVYIDVIANDFDADGDVLRVDGFVDAGNGDVYMQEDGRLLYEPNVGFTGTDTFRYWAADDEGHFVDATVTIDVW